MDDTLTDFEWSQCDCPVAREGMICKHTMKVFKMLHPDIQDGLIVRQASTLHGVDRGTPMSQCYSKGPQGLPNDNMRRILQTCCMTSPTVSSSTWMQKQLDTVV